MSTVPPLTLTVRLRMAREHAEMDQTEMALALGVSRNTVSRYENGTHAPSKGTIRDWAAETGVDFDWLYGDLAEHRRTSRLTKRLTDGYARLPLLINLLAS